MSDTQDYIDEFDRLLHGEEVKKRPKGYKDHLDKVVAQFQKIGVTFPQEMLDQYMGVQKDYIAYEFWEENDYYEEVPTPDGAHWTDWRDNRRPSLVKDEEIEL